MVRAVILYASMWFLNRYSLSRLLGSTKSRSSLFVHEVSQVFLLASSTVLTHKRNSINISWTNKHKSLHCSDIHKKRKGIKSLIQKFHSKLIISETIKYIFKGDHRGIFSISMFYIKNLLTLNSSVSKRTMSLKRTRSPNTFIGRCPPYMKL